MAWYFVVAIVVVAFFLIWTGIYFGLLYFFLRQQENFLKSIGQNPPVNLDLTFPQRAKMEDRLFWEIIESALQQGNGSKKRQAFLLSEVLSIMEDRDIIGFELNLQEKLMAMNHYHIKSLYQIIKDPFVVYGASMDAFKCWIISNGHEAFENALTDPNRLSIQVGFMEDVDNHDFLQVTHVALIKKYDKDAAAERPKQEIELLVNMPDYEKMDGEFVPIKEFKKRYPRLYQHHQTRLRKFGFHAIMITTTGLGLPYIIYLLAREALQAWRENREK